jgi:predicted O-linked N-acetylglucosamine transferase (SPINDLY family)
MARVLEENQHDGPAEAHLKASLELDPRQREAMQHYVALRQRQCLWPVVTPFEGVDRRAMVAGMSPLSIAAYTDDPLLQLGIAADYCRQDVAVSPADIIRTHWSATGRGAGERLRIGYLSSDLRHHAIGYLMAEVFELHDRSKVEIFAYYCGIPAEGDAIQARYRASADHFIDISALSPQEGARRIADDGIQILIDVNGYTREGRTKLVALRPAPVIVNWLGFPGTMASPHHHYIIADDWIIPPDNEIYYTEDVRRLPCYQPTDRTRAIAPTPTRAEVGLPEEGTVFCCFNGAHKITRFVFLRWMTILGRVPGSVLWLLDGHGDSNQRLKAEAERHGIAPERIIFAGKLRNPEHLARTKLADLVLDTTPYGAHTTASDALWVGVPVLTISGRSFASRVCGSLVRAAGLPELVCVSAGDYVDRAVALGRDPARLKRLREKLAENRDRSTLFDVPGLVRALEGLLEGMWADCLAERLPRPDLANLDVLAEMAGRHDHEAEEMQFVADYAARWQGWLAERDLARPIPRIGRLESYLPANV